MGNKLTYDEMIEKYGDVEVVFSSYYKFSFTFRNETKHISVTVGGMADDVYKFEVGSDVKVKIEDLGVTYLMVDGENVYTNYGW